MTQMNKCKSIFVKSLIQKDGVLRIPEQAIWEQDIAAEVGFIYLQGARVPAASVS